MAHGKTRDTGREPWEELYRNIRLPRLENTLVGFNMNLDRILPVTPGLLGSSLLHHPACRELRARLVRSMQYCTAEEWFVSDIPQYRKYTRAFSAAGTVVVGGQAGIAALHLAGLGTGRVICVAPAHGRESAAILARAGVIVPDFSSGNAPAADTTHLVFEYPPGLVPPAPGVIPRSNRFIVSPVHEPASVLIPEPMMGSFLDDIGSCNRAFLSGYQYLRAGQDFTAARDQAGRMKQRNSSLRIHIECVSVADGEILAGFTRHILPVADSLGLNEHELFLLLDNLGLLDSGSRNAMILTPVQIIRGALALSRHLNIRRLHLHTFGYYIGILHKTAAHPLTSRNALLYASREVARAARGTGTRIAEEGIAAAGIAADLFSEKTDTGIFIDGADTILVVPALIAAGIARTTGLGDILSSTAFAADVF